MQRANIMVHRHKYFYISQHSFSLIPASCTHPTITGHTCDAALPHSWVAAAIHALLTACRLPSILKCTRQIPGNIYTSTPFFPTPARFFWWQVNVLLWTSKVCQSRVMASTIFGLSIMVRLLIGVTRNVRMCLFLFRRSSSSACPSCLLLFRVC